MINFLEKILTFAKKKVEQTGAQYTAFGLFGLFNYPIFYFIWIYFSKQPYSNITVRVIATILCLILALNKYWPTKLKKYLPIYWYITLLYCLPFFFTFMLLKNLFAPLWLTNSILALYFLMLLVDFRSFMCLFFTGAVLGGLLAYMLPTHAVSQTSSIDYFGIIATYLVSLIIGGMFAHNREKIETTRLLTMKSIGATLAHELRTPLGAIKSGIIGLKNYIPELLQGFKVAQANELITSEAGNEQLEMIPAVLDSINDEANHASTIVELLLTNISQQEIKTERFSSHSIFDCINYALSHYPFLPSQKEKIEWQVNDNKDFNFFGDKLLIVHILFNLLKNALYFLEKSRKGAIYIWLEQTPKYNQLHFKDTGQGISEKDLPHIFDRFFTKDTHRGSGIGLAFCKMVMEAHNGKITCRSVEGKYTEFILSFQKLEREKEKFLAS